MCRFRGENCTMLCRLDRIKEYRWDTGSVLPPSVRVNLSQAENVWFQSYNRVLADYMRSLGDHGGIDLAQAGVWDFVFKL